MYMPHTPAQNRHILSMMGIVLWAEKFQKIKSVEIPPCRLTAHARIEHLIPNQIQLQGQDLQGQANVQHTENENTKDEPISAQTNITYYFQGVQYDRWTLVVDMDYLDQAAQNTWLSLCQSLAQQAHKTGRAYRMNEVRYPLVANDYPSHQINCASEVFLGFMFGLSLSATPQTAFLSPINPNITYATSHTLPNIADMTQDSALKKQFWQIITT